MTKNRIIIKISGEALAGEDGIGINPKVVKNVAKEIKSAFDLGMFEIGVIVGGGNIFRGKLASEMGIERLYGNDWNYFECLSIAKFIGSTRCQNKSNDLS